MEQNNFKIYFFILLAIVISVLLSVIINSSMTNSNMKVSSSMMMNMMGKSSFVDLPLKTASNRIDKLSFVEKEGVKEFQLSADPIRWEYAKDLSILAWGYNGQVPGPEIRVTEGDKVRIIFKNNLPKATTIHWHGIDVPNNQDGVPGVTQEPIKPGETFTYEFTAKPTGTRFYHTHGTSHSDEAQQLDMGLSGAFIIEPKVKEKYDKEYTLVLDEWEIMPDGTNAALISDKMGNMMAHSMNYNLFTINGKAFPYTVPLNVKQGDKVLIRLINAGSSTTHPMHLHGQSFKIVAVDGNPVPKEAQLIRDTLPISPGERYDIEIIANNPGEWVLHCHELHHADGGMITLFSYEGYSVKKEIPQNTKVGLGHGMHR